MNQNAIIRSLYFVGALILLPIGCEDKVIRAARESHAALEKSTSEAYESAARSQRTILMFELLHAAQQELQRVKDKDPKTASRHRAFLRSVAQTANGFTDRSFDNVSTTDWPASRWTERALDGGYEDAKLGADDKALAMTFKEPLLAAAKRLSDKRELEQKQEEDRKKGRASWK